MKSIEEQQQWEAADQGKGVCGCIVWLSGHSDSCSCRSIHDDRFIAFIDYKQYRFLMSNAQIQFQVAWEYYWRWNMSHLAIEFVYWQLQGWMKYWLFLNFTGILSFFHLEWIFSKCWGLLKIGVIILQEYPDRANWNIQIHPKLHKNKKTTVLCVFLPLHPYRLNAITLLIQQFIHFHPSETIPSTS